MISLQVTGLLCGAFPPRDEFTGDKQHQRSSFRFLAHVTCTCCNCNLCTSNCCRLSTISDRTACVFYTVQHHQSPPVLKTHSMVVLPHVTSNSNQHNVAASPYTHSRDFRASGNRSSGLHRRSPRANLCLTLSVMHYFIARWCGRCQKDKSCVLTERYAEGSSWSAQQVCCCCCCCSRRCFILPLFVALPLRPVHDSRLPSLCDSVPRTPSFSNRPTDKRQTLPDAS